ncbi:hypothetical protein [Pseudohongiella nitratireducens]|uniref:hypothetical protein n=1 Tax=Pseudohongiella nitratireducens TaxID=1768907 RepID=UPI0030EC16AA|tara:strand:+ start:2654 stop:3415 length:762 start_codon:yes stop_codon:yes gene_type:complete
MSAIQNAITVLDKMDERLSADGYLDTDGPRVEIKEAIQALQSLEGEAVNESLINSIASDICESDVYDQDKPDSVCISVSDLLVVLGNNLSTAEGAPALYTTPQPPAAPDDQRLVYNLRESVQIQERKIERLSELLQKASDYKDYLENPEESPVWIWQGDGEDRPDSMVNSLTVVIRADQLRALVDKAKNDAVRDGFVRVPPGVIRDAVSDLKEVQMRLNQSGAYTDPQTTVRICLDRTLEALLTAAQQGDGNE